MTLIKTDSTPEIHSTTTIILINPDDPSLGPEEPTEVVGVEKGLEACYINQPAATTIVPVTNNHVLPHPGESHTCL